MLKLLAIMATDVRDAWLLRITAFCWLMAKLIGWRMFTTYRLFPTAPVFDLLNGVPQAIHTFLYAMAVLLMLLIMLVPRNKFFLFSLLLTEVLSCLLDKNRIQPWDYQYLFLLFIFITSKNGKHDINTRFGLVVISTYVYAGLSKINAGFLHGVWGQMLLGRFLHIHPQSAVFHNLLWLGYFVPFFEIATGIGLIFQKTRKTSAWLLIIMHVFILVLLGPTGIGLNYNMVIWPWNFAMPAWLYLIFLNTTEPVIQPNRLLTRAGMVVVLCWVLLPAFSFVGLWDNYLSASIYSGKLPQMVICVKDTGQCRPLRRFYVSRLGPCGLQTAIDLQYWALTETRMAPYPEVRTYKEIADKLQQQYPAAGLRFTFYQNGQIIK